MRLLVLLAPLMLLLVYGRFGKERFFTVPASLSYVPNKRKPWQVNLIFKGDPFDFDKDGFYATILNLHRQDLVEILSDEANDLKIRLLKDPAEAEDDYERSVLNFLHKDAVEGVFSYNSFERKIESLRNRAYNDSTSALNELNEICGDMTDLMAGPGEAFGREFFTNYGKATAMMAILPMALIAGSGILCLILADDYPQLNLAFYSALVFLAQSCLPAFAAPRAFFGRWNADYYKEKLEWDAFRAFLSDYAMIQKCIPEDISIWKDWLIYGTALGVGKNVVKSMDQLTIPAIPEVHAVTFAPVHFERAYSRSTEHVITKSEIAARERMSSGSSWGDPTLTPVEEAVLVAVDVVAAVAEEDTVEVVVEPGKLSHILYIFSCLNFDRLADIVNLLRFYCLLGGKMPVLPASAGPCNSISTAPVQWPDALLIESFLILQFIPRGE